MKKAFLNWSSGKDAAFALYQLQREEDYSVDKLVTTINTVNARISMHGVREELLRRQARSLDIPLHVIPLDGSISMETYNRIMQEETAKLLQEGFTHSVFGDIFLEDLKAYREEQLARAGLTALFPLWKKDTTELMRKFLQEGFKAISVSVNARLLDSSFCGQIIDEKFLARLPEDVDPCGENGEFHTFVFDGPNFREPVDFHTGEIVSRDFRPKRKDQQDCFSDTQQDWDTSFLYCDLVPDFI